MGSPITETGIMELLHPEFLSALRQDGRAVFVDMFLQHCTDIEAVSLDWFVGVAGP